MTQHQQALAFMRQHIGEHEQPMGSNRGHFVQACQAATWLAGSGWPWCVAAWVKAWTTAGRKLPYLGAGAYAMLDWYRKNLPGWVVPLEKAKPGAAVIFNIGSGHCAMLDKKIRLGDTHVSTVDGNVSDSLDRRSRPISLVRGVIDPAEDIGVVKPAKPPLFEVIGSESGHKKIYVSTASAVGKKLPLILKRHPLGVTIRRKKR